jgi:hypothetical protein
LVHVDQVPKPEVAQWTGHGPSVHTCVSAVCGHAAPPFCGGTWVRLRDWTPLPHDVVQVDHMSNVGLTMQSMGHVCELQLMTSWRCEHDLPANCIALSTVRLRFFQPTSQDAVQALKVDHCESSQLIGHMMSPHVLDCSVSSQLPPKEAAELIVRERVEVPQPKAPVQQVSEQEVQLPQRLRTQFCGHSMRLQSRVCWASHTLPPFVATEFCSKRVWVPVAPHEAEHASQAPQTWTQSCGQSAVLHSRSWVQYVSPLISW